MIVIGTSSGGLKAMKTLLGGLPADFPLPVAVVFHRHKEADDSLQPALQRCTKLPLSEAMDKEAIEPGHIYIAPADYHLLVEPATFSLSIDEHVLYARPSIDVLFESAADVFGERAIAVVLTGASQDGARGAASIEQRGGRVIVQDPATAEYPTMPGAALAATKKHLVKPLGQIAATLVQLAAASKRSAS
jgi:two-component system chemotaxis response regulator CheB